MKLNFLDDNVINQNIIKKQGIDPILWQNKFMLNI